MHSSSRTEISSLAIGRGELAASGPMAQRRRHAPMASNKVSAGIPPDEWPTVVDRPSPLPTPTVADTAPTQPEQTQIPQDDFDDPDPTLLGRHKRIV